MRIAVVVTSFPVLSETFVLNQITGLIDRGHEVEIFAGGPGESVTHPDVEKYGLHARTTYFPWVPRNLFKRILAGAWIVVSKLFVAPVAVLRCACAVRGLPGQAVLGPLFEAVPFLGRDPYDVILCHFGYNGRKLAVLKRLSAVQGALITVFHAIDLTTYVNNFGERVYDQLFETGALFLPISEHWRARLIGLGCADYKIAVHRMGIDCGRFIFRSRNLDGGDEVRLLSVSRLVEKKGLEFAIRAIHRLQQRHAMRIAYTIVGDGPLRDQLAKLVEELGLVGTVTILGPKPQSQIIDFLQRAHVFVAPSVTASDGDQEGIPVALMEAMAMGLPVVSTFHSGIPELVRDGISGHLVPEGDVNALAAKLEDVITHPETWALLGRAARTTIENEYDIETLNSRLAERFRHAVSASNRIDR